MKNAFVTMKTFPEAVITTPADDVAQAGRAVDATVIDPQSRLLLANAPRGVIVNLIVGPVVAYTFWGVVSPAVIIAWLATLLATQCWRGWVAYGFQRSGGRARVWVVRYMASVVASGLVWGCSAHVFGRSASYDLNVLLMFVMAGMTAGAIPLLAPVERLYDLFLAAFAAPVVAELLLRGDPIYATAAALILIYAATLYATAATFTANVRASFDLARSNENLVKELQTANAALGEEIAEHRISEARFRAAFADAPIGMALCDGHRIVQANRAICDILGRAASELQGQRFADVTHPADVAASDTLFRNLLSGRFDRQQLESRYLNGRGEVIRGQLSVSALRAELGSSRVLIVQLQDITETRRMSDTLRYQALHDELTGLMNRREFELRIAAAIASAAATESSHAVCVLDLDQFKIINDTCGPAGGDQLLCEVATALEQAVRRTDVIARLGGDEFGIFMEKCNVDDAQRAAQAMRKKLEKLDFQWEEKRYKVGASIGVVPITGAGQTVADIFAAADTACHAAKERGGNRIHTFYPTDHEVVRRQHEMEWVERIDRAIDEDGLQLMFQTIAPARPDANSGLHFELLVRMREADGSLVPPSAFLPVAERYHRASCIDRWVVATALRWVREERSALATLELCSINLSAQSITNEDFLHFALAELQREGVPPQCICFEITETAAIANLPAARRFIAEIKSLGCQIALDDFGSGLSSFGYLKSLPVDILKIDGVFVKDLLSDPVNLAMVRSINEIGQVLGKRTVAEFVETQGVRDVLAEMGVDFVQGYGIDRPQPLEVLTPRR